MSQQPVDLTTPQPAITVEPPPAPPPEPRPLDIRQLLARVGAMATERAAATEDPHRRQQLERVAQLAGELSEALTAVEAPRGPG